MPRSNSEGSLRGIRVLDLYTNLKLQHEFDFDKNETVIWAIPLMSRRWRVTFLWQKNIYLKRKIIDKIANSNNIF